MELNKEEIIALCEWEYNLFKEEIGGFTGEDVPEGIDGAWDVGDTYRAMCTVSEELAVAQQVTITLLFNSGIEPLNSTIWQVLAETRPDMVVLAMEKGAEAYVFYEEEVLS